VGCWAILRKLMEGAAQRGRMGPTQSLCGLSLFRRSRCACSTRSRMRSSAYREDAQAFPQAFGSVVGWKSLCSSTVRKAPAGPRRVTLHWVVPRTTWDSVVALGCKSNNLLDLISVRVAFRVGACSARTRSALPPPRPWRAKSKGFLGLTCGRFQKSGPNREAAVSKDKRR
jgi:hypothetical protein